LFKKLGKIAKKRFSNETIEKMKKNKRDKRKRVAHEWKGKEKVKRGFKQKQLNLNKTRFWPRFFINKKKCDTTKKKFLIPSLFF
jgi:hypothetical protein